MTIQSWQTEVLVGMTASAIVVPFHFRKKIGTWPAILWAYCMLSALYVFMNPINRYGNIQFRVDQSCGQAFAVVALMPAVVAMIKSKTALNLIWIFELYAVASSVLMLMDANGNGIMQVSSLDSSFLAALYPMILFRPDKGFFYFQKRVRGDAVTWVWTVMTVALPLAAIVHAKGATAIFTLCAGLTAYAISTRRYLAISAFPVVLGLGYLTQGVQLFNPWDRFEKYAFFLKWWWANADIWTGTGIGTFAWLGPIVQNRQDGLYIWMHSDPIQFLFEGGILGFAIVATTCGIALYRCRNRPWVFSTAVGCIAMISFQFHLRFFFPAMFMLLILNEAMNDHENREEKWPKS